MVYAPILPRPYSDDTVTVDWATIPIKLLAPDALTPTQECVRLDRLVAIIRGGTPEGGDDALHIVEHDGEWLIHDGHTRWLAALIDYEYLPCRVWALTQ